VDPDKDRRLAEAMSGHFESTDRTVVEYSMRLARADVRNVVAMGPSAHHAELSEDSRLAAIPEVVDVTASVLVSTYRAPSN
jgi:23S rRNA (guanine745-N1)-methyltransferase